MGFWYMLSTALAFAIALPLITITSIRMFEPALSPAALATIPTNGQVPVAGGRSGTGRAAAAFAAPGAGHRGRGRLLATPGGLPLFDLWLLRGWGWGGEGHMFNGCQQTPTVNRPISACLTRNT